MLALLGREGVITTPPAGGGADPRAVLLLDGAAAAIRRLNQAGRTVIVLLERRHPGPADPGVWAEAEHRLRDALGRVGARVDRVVAPDRDGAGETGRLRAILDQHGATPADAVVVTDAPALLAAAAAAGCRRVLVRTGEGARTQAGGIAPALLPVAVHADLAAAVDALLGPDR